MKTQVAHIVQYCYVMMKKKNTIVDICNGIKKYLEVH